MSTRTRDYYEMKAALLAEQEKDEEVEEVDLQDTFY